MGSTPPPAPQSQEALIRAVDTLTAAERRVLDALYAALESALADGAADLIVHYSGAIAHWEQLIFCPTAEGGA